jgi:hypothetical protein
LRYYWEVRIAATRRRIGHGVGTPAEVGALTGGIAEAGEYLKIPAERLTVFVAPQPSGRMWVEAPSKADDLAQDNLRHALKSGLMP